MSAAAMFHAQALRGLEARRKCLYIFLAWHASDADQCVWASIATLALETGLDRKSVIQYLAEFIRAGLLVDTGKKDGKTGRIVVYQLQLKDVQIAAKQSQRRNNLKLSPRRNSSLQRDHCEMGENSSETVPFDGLIVPFERPNGSYAGTQNKGITKNNNLKNRATAARSPVSPPRLTIANTPAIHALWKQLRTFHFFQKSGTAQVAAALYAIGADAEVVDAAYHELQRGHRSGPYEMEKMVPVVRQLQAHGSYSATSPPEG